MQTVSFPKLYLRQVLKLQDSFSRRISYLRLSVTGRCSFDCMYCTGGISRDCAPEEMDLSEIISMARGAAAAGCTRIRLTGGEPLERRDIIEICRGITEIPEVSELALTTNGLRLTGYASGLRNAGVSCINISLDTVSPEIFRKITGRDCLRSVLSGLDAAVSAGFRSVKINTVLLHGLNDDEQSIRKLAEFTCRYPVDLRFIELMPAAKKDFSYSRYFSDKSAVFRALPELVPCADDEAGSGVAKMFRISGFPGRIGTISPVTEKFCRSCNRIRITSDGKLRPCLLSPAEYSLRGLTTEDIERKIRLCIEHKPPEHSISQDPELTEQNEQIRLTMQRIGG